MRGLADDAGDDAVRSAVVLDPSAPNAVDWTAEQAVAGGVVAFPTDTVYALAASLAHPAALARIFTVKGRPDAKPLPVLLASPANLRDIAIVEDDRLLSLANRFWPGPLTLVVPARDGLPPEVLGRDGDGGYTVAVRVPAHFLAIAVLEKAGGALAATSANRSGHPPACSAAEVVATIGRGIDVLLDGGLAPGGNASTIVAIAGDRAEILREGPIAAVAVRAVWDEARAGG